MSVVFLNYRRDDSAAWTGRLRDSLARFFSGSRLFMDVDGHIAAGSEYDRIIQAELAGCHALLAVIGPKWTTLQRDGRPRLLHDDDWVRREIAHALRRPGVVVMPVLVGGATLPAAADLPPDIAALVTVKQAARIDDDRWDDGVAAIVEALRSGVGAPLGPESDFDAAAKALSQLAELVRDSPAFARIVGRYEELVETYIEQIADLEFYKRLHDALHTVEIAVLNPLNEHRDMCQLVVSRGKFRQYRRAIEDCLTERPEETSLRVDLEAVTAALDGPTGDARLQHTIAAAVGALTSLVGVEPTSFNQNLVRAVGQLRRSHKRLDGLIDELRRCAERESPARVDLLAPVLDGLERFKIALSEFSRLVDEHSRIQSLDTNLRTLCAGGPPSEFLWNSFKKQRAELPRPFSAALAIQWGDLNDLERMVDAALATSAAAERLAGLHETMTVLFWSVDNILRDLSKKLLVLIGPLRTVIVKVEP